VLSVKYNESQTIWLSFSRLLQRFELCKQLFPVVLILIA